MVLFSFILCIPRKANAKRILHHHAIIRRYIITCLPAQTGHKIRPDMINMLITYMFLQTNTLYHFELKLAQPFASMCSSQAYKLNQCHLQSPLARLLLFNIVRCHSKIAVNITGLPYVVCKGYTSGNSV